ncbi:MAG TPA: hypothetical protein VLA13_01140, partial [Massilibacterium sp.]|nr:hypothetical protein [Massilibacterium sp.]
MSKRELTETQKVIVSEIPNFFQWHGNARKQVECLVENILRINQDMEGDIEKLKEHVRNENWSMVEIQAEKLGYYY